LPTARLRFAERRFVQIKQLSSGVIELDRTICTLPGSVKAGEQLVAISLKYLESISREAGNDLELSREISDDYWRMARIEGVKCGIQLGGSRQGAREFEEGGRRTRKHSPSATT
jgi:hypothetical protein